MSGGNFRNVVSIKYALQTVGNAPRTRIGVMNLPFSQTSENPD